MERSLEEREDKAAGMLLVHVARYFYITTDMINNYSHRRRNIEIAMKFIKSEVQKREGSFKKKKLIHPIQESDPIRPLISWRKEFVTCPGMPDRGE